ncbi:MAG: hypothetical protein NVS3B20_01210 [Polyangiales bacterium]
MVVRLSTREVVMRNRSLLWVVGFSLTGCSASSPPIEEAAKTSAQDVVFEAWDVKLASLGEAGLDVRRQAIAKAVEGSDADVLCLNEVWRRSDRDALVNAARARYPEHASFDTDLETAVDDPTDQHGAIPKAPSSPPCTGAVDRAGVERATACATKHCSTLPSDEHGFLTSYQCIQANCVAELFAVQAANPRCYNCIGVTTNDSSYDQVRQDCETKPKAGLSFGGNNGVLLLSRHPLSNIEHRVLPSTNFRRTVVRATVTPKSGAKVDVYCTDLSEIYQGLIAPYTGPYANGLINERGWAAEQLLQAKKLVAYVQEKSASQKAVVLGTFHGSTETRAGSEVVVSADQGEGTIKYLDSSLTPVTHARFKPSCTLCPDNPWMDSKVNPQSTDAVWSTRIYQQGILQEAVHLVAITRSEATLDWKGAHWPVSPYYGIRAVIEMNR